MVNDTDVAAVHGRERGVEDERSTLFHRVAGTKLESYHKGSTPITKV